MVEEQQRTSTRRGRGRRRVSFFLFLALLLYSGILCFYLARLFVSFRGRGLGACVVRIRRSGKQVRAHVYGLDSVG